MWRRAGRNRANASTSCASSVVRVCTATPTTSSSLSISAPNRSRTRSAASACSIPARWSREQLGEEGLDFLRGFEPTVDVDVGETKLVCCHATPQSNEDEILPDTPREDAERMIGNPAADAVAAGHVHLQWLRRFSSLLWFCVGSVGLVYEHKEPMDEVPFLPFCEYALFSEAGVDFHRIPFDVEELLAAARANDFPDVERYAATWQR